MGGNYDRPLKADLVAAGCRFVRQAKGSHELWYSPVTDRHFVVPANTQMRSTANKILKQAGVDVRL